jgi:hypothetical protein
VKADVEGWLIAEGRATFTNGACTTCIFALEVDRDTVAEAGATDGLG